MASVKKTMELAQLNHQSLFVYDHQDGLDKVYLVAFPESANDEALAALLRYGRQLQAVVNLDAWPAGEGPTGDAHHIGKSVPVDLCVERLREFAPALRDWDFHGCEGAERIVVRSFSRSDVLSQESAESFLLEALCHGEEKVVNIWMTPISPLALSASGDVKALALELDCPLVSRADVVDRRHDHPRLLKHTGVVRQKLLGSDFEVHSFYSSLDQRYHWAFSSVDFKAGDSATLTRIEFECLTGHVFGSTLCSCSQHMEESLRRISADGMGLLVYLRQGPAFSLASSNCQFDDGDVGEEAKWNASLILKHFGIERVQLLEGSIAQRKFLAEHGIVVEGGEDFSRH
jgi:GTP cyclohydrolase II